MICGSCAAKTGAGNPPVSVVQLGGVRDDFVVALAGNPNTGKSTVFNALTGLRQHTGNWPGKTVTRAEGVFTYSDKRFRLVDLPGTYSLLAGSTDEEIARDYLLFGRPDCTVVVCDATVLERNLYLALQILEITDRVVLCVNLMDEADRKRIALEARVLEKELGVPVVPTAARRGQGLDHLLKNVHEVASGRVVTQPKRATLNPEAEAAIEQLVPSLVALIPGLPCPRWIAIRLLEDDQRVAEALQNGELRALADRRAEAAA